MYTGNRHHSKDIIEEICEMLEIDELDFPISLLDAEDDVIDYYIEAQRKEYLEEWYLYLD